jgi:hypothetical protein
MTITKRQAEEIFGKVIAVFPTNIMMAAYDNHAALRRDVGAAAPRGNPAAYYSAGVLYVMLESMTDYADATMTIAHEVGHQVFDPGSIFAGVITFRLWVHHFSRQRSEPERNFWHMQQAGNIYSDIVLNRTIWKDQKANDILGRAVLNKGFIDFYHCVQVSSDLKNDIDGTFRNNFLAAGMALGYLEIHDPSGFRRVVAGIREPHLKKAVEIMNYLVDERNLALKNLQKYYDVAVELYDHLFELDKMGFQRVRG